MTTLVLEAHKLDGDLMFPDDIRYEFVVDVLDALAEGDYTDPGDASHEWADATADTSYHDLAQWLASHSERSGFCDRAADDFGMLASDPLWSRISLGQYLERRLTFESVLSSLQDRLDAMMDAA